MRKIITGETENVIIIIIKLFDIHDLLVLKIIVDKIENCYRLLVIINNEYPPINDKFKDSIRIPIKNMYRSLYTTMVRPADRLVQT